MSRTSNRRVRLLSGSVTLASLLVFLPLFAAGNEALQQLERMSQAAHTLNYEGTFVYLHGNHVQSVRIVHGVDAKGEHERLVTLSGKTREVIRDNDEVKCFFPDDRAMQLAKAGHTPPLPMIKAPNVERFSNIYQLELKESERVAGREADHVAVIPRDNFRYGRGYWIDQQAGLLLRADLVDDHGRVVEQMMFTSIEILDAMPKKSLVPENSARDFIVLKPAQTQSKASSLEGPRWEAASLPPGFELESTRQLTMQGKPAPVEHHVYGDGLTSVSVFVEAGGAGQEFVGHSRMGAVNAYAWQAGDARVVVVGEVPAITVERIATAMRPRTMEAKP